MRHLVSDMESIVLKALLVAVLLLLSFSPAVCVLYSDTFSSERPQGNPYWLGTEPRDSCTLGVESRAHSE